MNDEKRLFFSADVTAVWPSKFPPARIIEEQSRHITLAFLGKTSTSLLMEAIKTIPRPAMKLGLAAYSKNWVFLPSESHARAIAAKVDWIGGEYDFLTFQTQLEKWLQSLKYLSKDNRPFFPHITVGRKEFDLAAWKETPCAIPLYISGISLQESLGQSHYKRLWSHPFIPPFEEIEHTADIAFLIRGSHFRDLFLHAQLALAFQFPGLLSYLSKRDPASLDEVVQMINGILAAADHDIGIPFKAVSYHAEVSSGPYLEWKMIVDV